MARKLAAGVGDSRDLREVHLAIYLPGGYVPGQDPFAQGIVWVTIRALEDAGAMVVPVRYDDSILATDRNRFESGIRREVRGALSFYQPDRVTFLGMSRGTHAVRLVAAGDFELPEDTRLIWLSPAWNTSDDTWSAAKASKLPSLHIVGLADQIYDPGRHSEVPGETLAIHGADHSLEVPGDILATLEAWGMVANAVLGFAGRRESSSQQDPATG